MVNDHLVDCFRHRQLGRGAGPPTSERGPRLVAGTLAAGVPPSEAWALKGRAKKEEMIQAYGRRAKLVNMKSERRDR